MNTTFRAGPAILEQRPFIVVGVDGSACSHLALRWALWHARRIGAVVDAVHVWSDPWSVIGPPSLITAGQNHLAAMKQHLSGWVDRAVASEQAWDVPVVQQVVAGDAALVLLEESRRARMLVIGTRGHSRFERWLLGSVSNRCAAHATVPLLLVPEGAEPGTDDRLVEPQVREGALSTR